MVTLRGFFCILSIATASASCKQKQHFENNDDENDKT